MLKWILALKKLLKITVGRIKSGKYIELLDLLILLFHPQEAEWEKSNQKLTLSLQ